MRTKIILLLILSLFLVLVFIAAYFAFFDVKKSSKGGSNLVLESTNSLSLGEGNYNDCISGVEERIVQGNSLSGLIDSGSKVRVLKDYYQCNNPLREQVVAYNYSGDKNPIIKIVKGIPGDSWEVFRKSGGYGILVNGQVLKNSLREEYFISDSQSKMLLLYTSDYPVIPQDSYLLLGNLVSGSIDSTRFGLVSREDIMGRVVY